MLTPLFGLVNIFILPTFHSSILAENSGEGIGRRDEGIVWFQLYSLTRLAP